MDFDKALEKLSGEDSFKRDCQVGGLKFTLKLLSFTEESKLSAMIDEIGESEEYSALNEWKKYVVAIAIYALDGETVPDVVEKSGERVEKTLYMKGFLDKVPAKVIDLLFDVYTDLKEEVEANIESNLKCNWFKDPDIRKAEDEERLKKDREKLREQLLTSNVPLGKDTPDSGISDGTDNTPVDEGYSDEEDSVELKKI